MQNFYTQKENLINSFINYNIFFYLKCFKKKSNKCVFSIFRVCSIALACGIWENLNLTTFLENFIRTLSLLRFFIALFLISHPHK